jgi:lysophospholipase L1-like esterase
MEGAIMDGATPARMRGEFNLDGTHMNAAGMDVMAGLLAGYLRQFV